MSAPALFRILHPAERALVGSLAVAGAAVCGYVVFVSFSDATALQRAAGPQGTHLGARGSELVLARTGRDWRGRGLERRATAARAASATRLAVGAP
jgi:hypothetical protein